MTTYFKDAPGPDRLPIPQWALDLGFTDQSWHNEMMARMEYEIPPHNEEMVGERSKGRLIVTLWVTNEKPADRENSDTDRRFVAMVSDRDFSDTVLMIHPGTDDEEEFRLTVVSFMAFLQYRDQAVLKEAGRLAAQRAPER